MDFNELIIKRRSCRRYSEGKSIDEHTIEEILTDAQYSPSWCNYEGYKSYVALSPETVQAVYESLPDFNKNNTVNACAFIISTYVIGRSGFWKGEQSDDLGVQWAAYDLGLHDAYMLLSLKNHGYDSLVMGLRDRDKLREMFDIPEKEVIMSVIAVGQSDGSMELVRRKNLSDVALIK